MLTNNSIASPSSIRRSLRVSLDRAEPKVNSERIMESSGSPLPSELKDVLTFIEGRLYWTSMRRMPLSMDSANIIYISLDDCYSYEPFCHDFGPVNLGFTIRLARKIDHLLTVSLHGADKELFRLHQKRLYYSLALTARRERTVRTSVLPTW